MYQIADINHLKYDKAQVESPANHTSCYINPSKSALSDCMLNPGKLIPNCMQKLAGLTRFGIYVFGEVSIH